MATRSRASASKGSPFLPMCLLPIIVALGIGCASIQDTPQQEYVWAMGRICDAKSNSWYMDNVEADGRYTIRGATNSVASPNLPYFDCMREQFKDQPYSEWTRPRRSSVARTRSRRPHRSRAAACLGAGNKVDPTFYWIKFPVRTYQHFEDRVAIPAY